MSMHSANYTCPACGVPFPSPSLLDNHQRRFCINSRVDREAANIMSQVHQPAGGDYMGPLMVPPPKPPHGVASAPPRMYQPPANYRGMGSASSLPSVDFELFQLIKTQQQQIALIQSMMNAQFGSGGPRVSPRQQPPSHQQLPSGWPAGPNAAGGGMWDMNPFAAQQQPLPAHPQHPQAAPLASVTGESSLTEGRYGIQLFGVEGLDHVLSCAPEDVSLIVREYVASVDEPPRTVGSRERSRGGVKAPALFLDSRGDRTFGPGCIGASRSGRTRGQNRFKDVEVSFSVLQNRELHVFVVELYTPDGRMLAWTEITLDALGEKARPLRAAPVDVSQALKTPSLRIVPGALIGIEAFRTSWKQQLHGSSSRHRPSGTPEESDDEERNAPPRRSSSIKHTASPSVVSHAPQNVLMPSPQPALKRESSVPMPTTTGDPLSLRSSVDANDAARADSAGSTNTAPPPPHPTAEAGEDDASAVKVGKGPTRDAARIAIDTVVGVPFHVSCSRVVIYFASAKVDGEEIYPRDADDFFTRKADVVAYQTLDSSTMEPVFTSETNLIIGKHTTAVAIVECVDPKKNTRFTLGHAVLPLNQDTNAGNYMTRLLWGDPRPSHLRHPNAKAADEDAKHRAELEKYDTTQLNASLLSRELKDALKDTVPSVSDRVRFCPCAYIKWRADSNDRKRKYKEPPGQFPATPDEAILVQERQMIPSKTLMSLEVTTQDQCVKLFDQKWTAADDALAYVAPYNPSRGLFVAPECLRGMTPEHCLYKVMIEMSVEGGEKSSNFTQRHDYESDIGVPEFLDEPFVFAKVPYSQTGVAVFRVFKMMDPSVERPGGIMPLAWSATKLFLDDGVVRHGRFSVPLFTGSPPPRLIDELKKERIDQTILKWTGNPPSGQQKLEYLKPNCVITFCQGDAVRGVELVKQKEPFRSDPRILLVPTRVRRQFPFQEDEGYLDEQLSNVLPDGMPPTVFDEEMNKQIKKYFKKL